MSVIWRLVQAAFPLPPAVKIPVIISDNNLRASTNTLVANGTNINKLAAATVSFAGI